jgi:hypothetical protein
MNVPKLSDIPDPEESNTKTKLIDFSQLQKTLKEDDDPLEFYNALKGVALFENKMSGKPQTIRIKRPILDKSVITKYKTFESPVLGTPEPKYAIMSQPVSRIGSPRTRSKSTLQGSSKYCSACNMEQEEKKVYLNSKPFNVIDEPMKLTPKAPSNYYTRPINENPWYSDFQKDNSRGIPFFSSSYKRAHQRKIENYRQSVRYQLTLDRKRKEDQQKKKMRENIDNFKKKRDMTDELYIKSGQGWCLDALEKIKHKNDKPEKPKKPDPFEIEAIQRAAIKDAQIREMEKLKSAQKTIEIMNE